MQILTQFHQMGNQNVVMSVEPVLKAEQIAAVRSQVRMQRMEEKLMQFIATFIHTTRNHKSIYLGGSPRASLAIMNASKAMAAINGRDFVTPEDILEVIPPVMRHRIILSPDKEMEGVSEDTVIKQILGTLEIPR
jgi:MoxR-like ATPase